MNLKQLPSRRLAHLFIDKLMEEMFPAGDTPTANDGAPGTTHLFEALLKPIESKLPVSIAEISTSFFQHISKVKADLLNDADFFVKADPAAESIEEVVVAYPGFYAIAVYRLAHVLYNLQVPLLPRLMTEYAHSKTGIDIHPGATIGVPFFIDHGTGIVVGQTSQIGRHVKMYQGVTLGALAVKKDLQGEKRHPTIEDNVIIYAGSCILGGTTTVGHDSVIGGNVWLTESVLPFSIVYHKSEVEIRDKSIMNEVIDYII